MSEVIGGFFDKWVWTSDHDYIVGIANRYGVGVDTKKPLRFDHVASKIGEDPALMMLSLLKAGKSSIAGVESIIEIIRAIAGDELITVVAMDFYPDTQQLKTFKLSTPGFLKSEFDNCNDMECVFVFTPECQYLRSIMRNGEIGKYVVDLNIDLYIRVSLPWAPVREGSPTRENTTSVKMATVAVEFDGPLHLQDEHVRHDKLRDSMLQGLCVPVFRVQTPYKFTGKGSEVRYRNDLSNLLDGHIGDIKNLFIESLNQRLQMARTLRDIVNYRARSKVQG